MKCSAEKGSLVLLFSLIFAAAINVSGQQVNANGSNPDNGAVAAKNALDGKTGDLIVSSDHAGALVEIDGKRVAGETPLTLKWFPAGDHHLVVRKGKWYGAQQMTVAPDTISRVTIRMQDESGSLKVFSEPAGAGIVIDGKTIGVTPLKIVNVDAGERSMELRLQGYMVFKSSVQITADETQNISVTLKPLAFISVKAQPASASIIINGAPAGTGEVSRAEVLAGDVALSIEAPGYDSYKETIPLKPGELRSVNKTLATIFGMLTLTTVPTGATLSINGTPSGTTPYHSDSLMPGNYRLRLELQGYEPMEGKVALKAGEQLTIEKKLVSSYGTLSVSTTPAGAAVSIDSQLSGTTPFRTDKLAPGRYRLRLDLQGYAPVEDSLTLKAGEQLAVEKKMVSIYGALSVSTTPVGAAVFINSIQSGTTPYRNEKMMNGKYSLRIELPGYTGIPLEDITIDKETEVKRQYTLTRSKVWLDSIAAYNVAHYRHKRWVRRIVFGSLAAATGGAGYFFESRVAAAVKDQNRIQADYRAATIGFSDYQRRYNNAGDKAATNAVVRNILYGVAGAFAVVFVISIPF
jgi:hypothetical protein